MPVWPARPHPWPSTVEAALSLPEKWHVSEAFLHAQAGNPDPERRALLIQSYIAFLYNSFVPAQWLNAFVWKCTIAIVLFGILQRLVALHHLRSLPCLFRRAHTVLSRHYSLAPLVGKTALAPRPVVRPKAFAAWTTIQVPLRSHAILVAAFVGANLLVVLTGYDIPWPNGFYSEENGHFAPLLRHMADRTGVLALGSTPLVFLLAARNSPLTWLTGVDFGTLQIYHRWVARVTYLNVTLHMLGYSYIHLQAHGWALSALFVRKYLFFGWLAFLGGWLLCFGAWRRIRQLAYELFLVVHILSAIAWVVGAYLHIFFLGDHSASQEYLQLCYATVAFWAFDRGARRLLLLWRNTRIGRVFRFAPRVAGRQPLVAEGVLLGGSNDFVRLRITPTSPWRLSRGGPGSFVYISAFSAGHRVWESHPFSIAWPLGVPEYGEEDDDSGSGTSTPSSWASESTAQGKPTRLSNLAHTTGGAQNPVIRALHPFDEQASPASFELLVKRYSGFTRALVDSLSVPETAIPTSAAEEPLMLSAVPDDGQESDVHGPEEIRIPLRILVEGPYGAANSSHPCAEVRQALLVAGGSGVAMVTSQLADLGLRSLREGDETRCERATVVWTVREAETVALIIPYLHRLYRLFHALPSFRQRHLEHSQRVNTPFLDLHIYVTSASSSASLARRELDSLALPPAFLRSTLHEGQGRPDIGSHIDELALDTDELLVVSCGPATMCDSVREAVRARLGWGQAKDGCSRWEACRLMYSEEAVVW